MRFAGVVLVGGASRRMGRDKALLTVGGEPLIARQVRVLRESGAGAVFLAGRRGRRYDVAGTRFVTDAPGVEGPMAGILAALAVSPAAHLAVMAVDLPKLRPDWWQRLWLRCGTARGAVAMLDDRFEPLAAIYPRAIAPQLAAAARTRRFDLQSALRLAVMRGHMAVLPLRAEEGIELFNTNTPADFSRMGVVG